MVNFESWEVAEKASGTWTYPSSLSDNISASTVGAYTFSLAMNRTGDAIIVWADNQDRLYSYIKEDDSWSSSAEYIGNIRGAASFALALAPNASSFYPLVVYSGPTGSNAKESSMRIMTRE